jgi:hypothetical protein
VKYGEGSTHFWNVNLARKQTWLNEIDWYLQPIEITDEDIEAWANGKEDEEMIPENYIENNEAYTLIRYKDYENGLILGAKAMRDGEIKHIKCQTSNG